MKKALITGVSGQDGAYLAQLLLNKGYQVLGTVRDNGSFYGAGLKYLGIASDIEIRSLDLTCAESVHKVLKNYEPDEIYNLAAQSSVGYSFECPVETFSFNTISVNNLIESMRKLNSTAKMYQASSSEMYGVVDNLPITMDTPMRPTSPYAVSKLASHCMVATYRDAYDLYICSGILFNHDSFLRGENFFVKKVIRETINIKEGLQDELVVGNLNVKRDFGYAPKYVEAMWLMLQQDVPQDFCICSGTSIYLYEIVDFVFDYLNVDKKCIRIDKGLFRPNEVYDIYGDNSAASKELNWDYGKSFFDILSILIDEELMNRFHK